MAGNKINFEVGFQINSSNLAEIQNSLTKVVTTASNAKAGGKLTEDLRQAGEMAKQLSSILESSFNKDLGTLNITKFNEGLSKAHISMEQIQSSLVKQGAAGTAAYNKLTSSILNTNVQLRESNKLLNDMATTMANTVKWGIASSVLNTMTGAIRDAYNYSKQLNTSLTDIRIVTGDSAEQMAKFAEQANTAAKNLGANTLDYSKAALEYYQQGLGDEAVANRTEATIKAANVTGARASEVAENLTAVWNGFQVGIGQETEYVDKLAAVADSSASNLDELATAMSKVASVGNNLGVNMDQMNAQIATIVATTRQAPETVGNALKTIYARINDIKTGADGAEISLGNYSKKMESLGISVLDSNNNLRDTGEVFEEVGRKWGSMTKEQQVYLATTMAGQRQMNNLVALFDNWGQYSDMLNVSLNAQGTLEEKNNRYLESTQAHLNTLKSTWQDLYSTLIKTDEVNFGVDSLTNFVQMFDNFLEGFGGGIKSIAAFGTMVAFVFRDQIGGAIGNMVNNQTIAMNNLENMATKAKALQADLNAGVLKTPEDFGAQAEAQINQENANKLAMAQRGLTQEKQQELIAQQALIGRLKEQEVIEQHKLDLAKQQGDLFGVRKNEQQSYTSALNEELAKTLDISDAEENLVQTLKERLAQMKAINEQEDASQFFPESEIKAYEKAIKRAQAARKADAAEDSMRSARAQGGIEQADFDRTVQYAQVVANAKAKTDILTGSLTALTTAVGIASSAWRTLTDENASAADKFGQLIMLFSTMGPMLVSSVMKAREGVLTYAQSLVALEAAQAKEMAVEAAAAKARQVNAVSDALVKQRISLQGVLNTLKQEGAITEAAYQAAIGKSVAELDNETRALVMTALGVEGESTVAKEGTVTNLGFAASLKKVALSAAEALVPLLPYIAVIGAVAIAIGAAYLELTKYERAAEEASQLTTELATATREAKEEFNNAVSAFKGYSDAKAQLADLTEGTRAWKEQAMAVNAQVLDLLDKYPQLAKYVKNTGGVMEITAGGMEEVIDDLVRKQQVLAAAQLQAAEASQKAQIELQAHDIAQKAGVYSIQKSKEYLRDERQTTVARSEADKGAVIQIAEAMNKFPDAMGKLTDEIVAAKTKDENVSNDELAKIVNSALKDNSNLANALKGLDTSDIASIIATNTSGLETLSTTLGSVNDNLANIGNLLVGGITDQNIHKQAYNELEDDQKEIVDSVIGAWTAPGTEFSKAIEQQYKNMSRPDMEAKYQELELGTAKDLSNLDDKSLQNVLIMAEKESQVAQHLLGEAIDFSNQISQAAESVAGGLDKTSQAALAGYLSGNENAFDNLSTAELDHLTEVYDKLIPQLKEINPDIADFKDKLEALKEDRLASPPAVDEDLDADQLRELTDEIQNTAEADEELGDGLRENSAAAQDFAESILRFKDAQEDLDENFNKWMDSLQEGSGDTSKYIDELQDAYGDLLDIDGSQLSEDFVEDRKNLELMQQAAEGSEEAYRSLSEAAAKDILFNVVPNAEDNIEIQNQIVQLLDDAQAFLDANPAVFQTAIGDVLPPDVSMGLAQQFAQLVDMFGGNAQAAAAAWNNSIGQMSGVEAEVTEDTQGVNFEETPATANVTSTPHTNTVQQSIPNALGGTETQDFTYVDGITYTSGPIQRGKKSKVQTPAYGVKFRKTANGNGGLKYKRAGNLGGGSAPKSRGGGGGGGGKGGKGKKGGGGKKVEPPKKKEIKKDPYHDVNRQLGIVEDNLKKLQKEEKKLTGKQYLDNLVKQNQQLEKQRKLIKQKADIATTEIQRQQQELSRNYGFGFNSDGDISNYFNVLAKYQQQVEDLYNKAQKSPSETNNAKYQKATEDYDAMMKAIDAYEKDLDIYNKQIQDDLDALNEMIENNIKRFNYTIDLHLDTADFEKDLKEFRRDVLDQIKEDDYINLSSYGLSIGQDTLEDAKELVQHVKDIQNAIAEMNKGNYNASPYHDDMKSAMEDLQKYTEELMKRGEDIADIQEDIHDNWMDAIDDAQDAFDEQKDEYEQINDLIEHNLDMLEMLHGDEAYSQMANLYQQQADNSMKNIQLLAKERDFWFQQMNSVAEGSDAWKEYRKNWEDAVKDLNSGIKDTADYFYNRYEAIFNQLAKQLKDTFAGGDWNKRQTLWEDFLDDDDRYLDSLSRANGTYNLIQKTQEAIGNANLKHQKELNKWLDATTKNLESQTELRQIDLDIAEKELDIILKRQALEDAQNNKTKMRLRRDSQGNYRYQYVADTNDVAQKQQELRDAIEDLRLLVKEDFKDTVDRMYDQMDSFAEEAAEISEKYGFNTEEWNDQMALLQERYIKKTTKTANDYAEMMRKLSQATGVEATELFGQMGDEFMAALGMDSDTYKVFEQMFKPGGEYVDLIDGFITEIYTSSFDGVAEDVKDTFNDVTNLLPAAVADLGNNLGERIRDMLAQFMSDASDNQQEYVKNLEDVQNETGQHFDDLTTNMEGTIKATENLLLDNDKLITSYGNVINKVQEFADAIAKVVEQYKALSEAQINSTANTLLGNAYYQNGTTGVARYGVGGEDIRSIDENVDSISQVLRQLSSYDEGGWTGGGAELAVVHPNEYVLTSTDAPNMLAAAQIASQVMDRVADFKAAAMSQVGGAIGGLFSSVANADNSTTNEQQIIINADFPAVESAREIKQAFNELVNLASQRASGNRRTY